MPVCDPVGKTDAQLNIEIVNFLPRAPRGVRENTFRGLCSGIFGPSGVPVACRPETRSDAQLNIDIINFLPFANRATRETSYVALCVSVTPTPSPILHGVTVGGGGWPVVDDFEFKTMKMSMVRCYPAGSTLIPSLRQVDRLIVDRPGVMAFWSCFMANRGFGEAQIRDFANAIRQRANQLPKLLIAVDAEPDRRDRSYNPAQFAEGFRLLRNAVGTHPNVLWVLNLTGYLFTQRINNFSAAFGMADGLAVDPYWRTGLRPDQVQASEADIANASAWARDHSKFLAFGEWGAERRTGISGTDPDQIIGIQRAFDCIRRYRPTAIPYYQDDTSGPFPCALQGDAYDEYTKQIKTL